MPRGESALSPQRGMALFLAMKKLDLRRLNDLPKAMQYVENPDVA